MEQQDPQESRNDRNDRAIRAAVTWYQSHLVENGLNDVRVILLTNDKEHLTKSIDQGICVYTSMAAVNGVFIRLLVSVA